MDAVKLIVRGFQTQKNGKKICSVLEEYGFHIREMFDGASDSLGGIIETHIERLDNLTNDVKDIEIYDKGVTIETEYYELCPEKHVGIKLVNLE